MFKQHFDFCHDYGTKAEKKFAQKHLSNIVYSNKKQDMYDHWDVSGKLNNIDNENKLFDVKTTKRLNHSKEIGVMDSVWVEGKNIHGNKGWIYGIADYIVFEREETWMVVDRKELLDLTLKKLKENNYKKGKGVYLIHTRFGRKDKVTKVLFDDIKTIKHYELTK